MNSEEKKALAKKHTAIGDRWENREYLASLRVGIVGDKIDATLRIHMGEHRRAALNRPRQFAVAALIARMQRCERIATRHFRHALDLSESST